MTPKTQYDARTPTSAPFAFTVAWTLPIVGVGGEPGAPFICNARGDSVANPTLAGRYLNTEYTFLRKTSPTIHAGAAPLVGNPKNAPTHVVLEARNSVKSVGSIDQLRPPKLMLTCTVVAHG
jgi:hypothetical protein